MKNTFATLLTASALSLLSLAPLSGCSDKAQPTSESSKSVADYFNVKIGARPVRLQFAVLPLEQQQGLMFRTDIKSDEGMIFVYASPQRMSYWMRNTPTALDIGYFDASGTLLEIYPMYALDESPVRSRSEAIKFSVEMNQGWYNANGVRPGAKLDLEAVREAMKARGFSLRDWHLQPEESAR